MGTCEQVLMVLSFARKRLVERTVEAVGVRETKGAQRLDPGQKEKALRSGELHV